MSTRSRRSGGDGLNPAMIQLLPVGRLKTELESRGLSIVGSKNVLAERLQDAVLGIINEEPTMTPKGKGRKSVVKEEPPDISEVKVEEPDDEPSPPLKKQPRGRKRTAKVVEAEESMEEESLPDVKEVQSPKKKGRKKIKIEEESDPDEVVVCQLPVKNKAQPEEMDEEVPLLSLLSPKKPEPVAESSSGQKPCHNHGTRKAMAMQNPTNASPIIPSKKFLEAYTGDDLFDDDNTPDYKPETSPRKSNDEESREKVRRHSIEDKRSKEKKKEEKVKKEVINPGPPPKTIGQKWAEKIAEMKKQKAAETEAISPTLSVSSKLIEGVKPKPKLVQRSSTSSFVLDDILSQQEKEAMEEKRKQEEEERTAKEQERQRREKLAEIRRKKAEEDVKRAERLKNLPPDAIKPKAIPEPKMVHELKPHPYAIPQPLAGNQEKEKVSPSVASKPSPAPIKLPGPPTKKPSPVTSTTPKVATPGGPLLPPPPPPKKPSISSLNSPVAAASPVITKPPGPPPKKTSADGLSKPRLVPPPPPPKKTMVKTEIMTPNNEKKNFTPPKLVESSKDITDGEVVIEKATVAIKTEEEVDTSLVSSVAEAFLKIMKQRDSIDETAVLKVELPAESESTDQEPQERCRIQKDVEESTNVEEYDPLAQAFCDHDISAYIPSVVNTRNHTMVEEEEESEDELPSDDEIVGEMDDIEDDLDDDETDTDEEDSKENTHISPKKSPMKRPTNGDEIEALLQNPRDLLNRANAMVFSRSEGDDLDGPQYVQMPCGDDYQPEEEERKTPEYHGEPVPSDDEIDYFEQAAGIQKPKKKKDIVVEEEKLPSDEGIEPDYYNADLHIKANIDKNYLIEPENADGLALMWGGVRSTYGIKLPFRDVKNQASEEVMNIDSESKEKKPCSKKIVFQIKIVEFLATKHLPFEELDPHDVRVGFSLKSAPLLLGEHPHTYCITSLGKKATNNVFTDFGNAFHLNDVITSCIDLQDRTISYWKNNDYLGVAFSNVELLNGEVLFPHICIKNCNVAVNFGMFEGDNEEHPWIRNDEWRFMTDLGRGDLERSSKSPESKTDCTILMMVGLPGVGKTTWVREYLRDHPEEHWTLINTEQILAAMKVNGVSRKRAHQGRWDMVMGLIGKSLQRYVLLAARRRKNYILDMTNTSRDKRKQRLQLFEEFTRKVVILMPSDEEMLDRQARQARQEGIALMPPEAMLEMKAVISLPSQEEEPFEDFYFIEPPANRVHECIEQINRYNEEARPWFQKKYKRRRAQMIGLGDGIIRDPNMPKKPAQPLTVMPQLKVAVIPLDDPSNPGPISTMSNQDSTPTSASALGFTVVEDRPTSIRNSVHISIDTSVPPPQITPSSKPLVRVTIEDIPATAIPVSFIKETPSIGLPALEAQAAAELTEQELKDLKESVKTAAGGNAMMTEAIMRSRLKAMQMKKAEKSKLENRQSILIPSTPISIVPPPSPMIVIPSSTPATPTGVGRTIPTLGTPKPIAIDTTQQSSTSFNFPASNSPRVLHLHSPSMNVPPPSLAAPYLVNPSTSQQLPGSYPVGPPQMPPPGFTSFSQPPPSNFGNFSQPNMNTNVNMNMNLPPPSVIMNNGAPNYQPPWSQPNS